MAPLGQHYDGNPGQTQVRKVRYRCPDGQVVSVSAHTVVNAATDPQLAESLLAGTLNHFDHEGSSLSIDLPVVYHRPDETLFVLVLPESMRHQELQARVDMLLALAAEEEPVPAYVSDFYTVFGSRGLGALLAERKQRVDLVDEARALEARADELNRREAELEGRIAEIEAQLAELASSERELSGRRSDLEERERSLEDRSAALSRRAAAVEQRSVELSRERARLEPSVDVPMRQADSVTLIAESTGPVPRIGEAPAMPRAATLPPASGKAALSDSEDTLPADKVVRPIRPGGTEVRISIKDLALSGDTDGDDPDTTQLRRRPDVALHDWLAGSDAMLMAADPTGIARVAYAVDDRARGELLGETLQVKLQLHRMPTYPVPSLVIAPLGGFEDLAVRAAALIYDFNLEKPSDRECLELLARDFSVALDLYTVDRMPVRRRVIGADLGDNARYLLATADAYLETVNPSVRSAEDALRAVRSPRYDRFALDHPDRVGFRDDALRELGRPADVSRAVEIARRYSKPEREEYLILSRSYSLARWRQRRRLVIARAIELGLWVGPRLAQVAVSERLASSRKSLVGVLLRNFAELQADGGHGLDAEAVRVNWEALREEAGTLGVSQDGPGTRTIHSEDVAAVSGSIGTGPVSTTPNPGEAANLIARLDRDETRLDAAIELCRRGVVEAIPAVFRAIGKMTRSEAGRVLGAITEFGPPAIPHLLDGLGSRKGFVRQGCALALGVTGGEAATEALCDLLVHEPTEIWREVARAVGMLGPAAASSVVARVRQNPQHRDRGAWALANIAATDARVVESLARGRDPVAAEVAGRAIEMAGKARSEDAAVKRPAAGRDVTVNKAFSRRFFESMNGGAAPATVGSESSAPAMQLFEDDLLDARDIEEDLAEPLDENDLIPT